MEKTYEVQVFGKHGCDKCSVLNKRLDKLLEKDQWQDFEKRYFDVETVDGLVAFSTSECINPQRIPAMIVAQRDDDTATYEPVPNMNPGVKDDLCGNSRLYQHLGLQTDYSSSGRGLITPKMISTVLADALP